MKRLFFAMIAVWAFAGFGLITNDAKQDTKKYRANSLEIDILKALKLPKISLKMNALHAAEVAVSDVWVRQTSGKSTMIYLKIHNDSERDIALIDAESSLSDNIKLHTQLNDGRASTMVSVPEFAVPAHRSLWLMPGGDHIMLLDLKEPVNADTNATLVLTFDNGESIELENIEVKR